jgi:hypothetical protein
MCKELQQELLSKVVDGIYFKVLPFKDREQTIPLKDREQTTTTQAFEKISNNLGTQAGLISRGR